MKFAKLNTHEIYSIYGIMWLLTKIFVTYTLCGIDVLLLDVWWNEGYQGVSDRDISP